MKTDYEVSSAGSPNLDNLNLRRSNNSLASGRQGNRGDTLYFRLGPYEPEIARIHSHGVHNFPYDVSLQMYWDGHSIPIADSPTHAAHFIGAERQSAVNHILRAH